MIGWDGLIKYWESGRETKKKYWDTKRDRNSPHISGRSACRRKSRQMGIAALVLCYRRLWFWSQDPQPLLWWYTIQLGNLTSNHHNNHCADDDDRNHHHDGVYWYFSSSAGYNKLAAALPISANQLVIISRSSGLIQNHHHQSHQHHDHIPLCVVLFFILVPRQYWSWPFELFHWIFCMISHCLW